MEIKRKMFERTPFWLLATFLCIVFFTGGSTWSSESQLIFLRPVALIIFGVAIITLRCESIAYNRGVLGLSLAAVLLTAAHLVPLPYVWWTALPGREVIVAIDQAVGLGQINRPLSVSPDATLDALYSLSVPLAALLLAIQLSPIEHRRILILLLALAALSGFFGLLQAGGSDIAFYPAQTPTSGLFANRNHQGTLLALLIPLAAAVGAMGGGGRTSDFFTAAVGPAVTVIAIPLLMVTGSRSALVVAVAGLVFGSLIWWSARRGNNDSLWLKCVVLALFTSLVGGLVWFTAFNARDIAIKRILVTENELRFPVWQSIIEMLPHYMPWGTGIGTYEQAYQVLEPDSLLRPTLSNHAHNEFLEVALTAGVPGLILLAIAFAAVLFAFSRAFLSKPGNGPRVIFSQLGGSVLVLLAIASVSDYPTRTPILAVVLALASVWASMGGRAIRETKSKQGLK